MATISKPEYKSKLAKRNLFHDLIHKKVGDVLHVCTSKYLTEEPDKYEYTQFVYIITGVKKIEKEDLIDKVILTLDDEVNPAEKITFMRNNRGFYQSNLGGDGCLRKFTF